MSFEQIFDVFSRRKKVIKKDLKPLTKAFRNRVLMLCDDALSPSQGFRSSDDFRNSFWQEIHKKLTFLYGEHQLYKKANAGTKAEDAYFFVSECKDDHFLDFIEYIFKTSSYHRACSDESKLVGDIEQLFLLDNLPYALTSFVREKRMTKFHGQEREASFVVSYPKIILREDEIVHSSAIQPTLTLLLEKDLSSANLEFIAALEDYRKKDYGDCLTKCGSAFESTMKIICARNHWQYQNTDTASKLLKIIIDESPLEAFFEQPLIGIATLRNRLSTSHGSGSQPRVVSKHKAKYVINATASAILLLVDECL